MTNEHKESRKIDGLGIACGRLIDAFRNIKDDNKKVQVIKQITEKIDDMSKEDHVKEKIDVLIKKASIQIKDEIRKMLYDEAQFENEERKVANIFQELGVVNSRLKKIDKFTVGMSSQINEISSDLQSADQLIQQVRKELKNEDKLSFVMQKLTEFLDKLIREVEKEE